MSLTALLVSGVLLGLSVTLSGLTLWQLRRMSAQLAVLTMAVKEVEDHMVALDDELHTVDEKLKK